MTIAANCLLILLVFVAGITSTARADDGKQNKQHARRSTDESLATSRDPVDAPSRSRKQIDAKRNESMKGDAKRVAAAKNVSAAIEDGMRLVRQHLPQLRAVLKHLKSADPEQYASAMKDLERTAKRLENAKRRDTDLYQIEVRLVQVNTKMDLATARAKTQRGTDPEEVADKLRKTLQPLVQQRIDLERRRLDRQLHLMDKRIADMQQQRENLQSRRARFETNSSAAVDTNLRLQMRRAGVLSGNGKTANGGKAPARKSPSRVSQPKSSEAKKPAARKSTANRSQQSLKPKTDTKTP
ncbi:MAG: hypothetical protein AAFP90_05765 [Planctomycetota bacterium]